MTQVYKVQLSMNQRHLVESGLTFKQGDFGFQIEIEVLDFDVTGVTPQIIFRKSNGAVESTSITVSGNKFTYTMAGTELDTPGPAICDLKLKNSTTQRISTASFRYFVEPDTMDGLNEQAGSYSDTIAQIIDGYEEEISELKDAVVEIPTSKNIFNENWDKQNYTIANSGDNAGELVPETNYQATSEYLPFNEGALYFIQSSVAPACSIHFYDSSKNYLGTKALGNNLSGGKECFTGTAYLRFSTYIVSNWHMAICGVSSGAFTEYVPYTYVYSMSDTTKPIYFKIDTFAAGGEECFVNSHYGDGKDVCVRFWQRIRGNKFFDISQICTISNSSKIVSKDVASRDAFATNETEWHSPFKVTADSNGDGDCAADDKFTGGSHDYTNGGYTGSATMSVNYIKYYADGKEVKNGDDGYCNIFEVRWSNNVQGSNTEKSDGSGREILKENHRMIFNGDYWQDDVELIALEDIHIKIWYGFQLVGIVSSYPNFRYIGDSNRAVYTNSAAHNSGGSSCNKIIAYSASNKVEIDLDRTFDLGKIYDGSAAAFNQASANKCYFSVINQDSPGFAIQNGEMYCARGQYRFKPV